MFSVVCYSSSAVSFGEYSYIGTYFRETLSKQTFQRGGDNAW